MPDEDDGRTDEYEVPLFAAILGCYTMVVGKDFLEGDCEFFC